jgi:hypothetical protein
MQRYGCPQRALSGHLHKARRDRTTCRCSDALGPYLPLGLNQCRLAAFRESDIGLYHTTLAMEVTAVQTQLPFNDLCPWPDTPQMVCRLTSRMPEEAVRSIDLRQGAARTYPLVFGIL